MSLPLSKIVWPLQTPRASGHHLAHPSVAAGGSGAAYQRQRVIRSGPSRAVATAAAPGVERADCPCFVQLCAHLVIVNGARILLP